MKLIVTALDNTLLKCDKSISEYTAGVLRKCREKDILIAFATARAESAMARFFEAVKPDILISNGGAMIRVMGEIIYRNLMSSESVCKILEMSKKYTGNRGGITADTEDGYYCNFTPDDPDRRAAFTYSDFDNFMKPSYKITVELECEEWAANIVKECPDCTVHNFSGEIWRRFAAKNSDKERALSILAEYLHFEMQDIAAFGDDYNDLGMLKLAGTAVAVSNAIDDVKRIADYVADCSDNDGVAKFIEYHIL